jgi:hypothetical protein
MAEVLFFKDFEVAVIRANRRRSASIKVDQSGVAIRVPKDLAIELIRELIEQKTTWINKKLERAASLPPASIRQFKSGEFLPYLGESCVLIVEAGEQLNVTMHAQQIQVTVKAKHLSDPTHIKKALERWLLDKAAVLFAERLDSYAPKVGVRPKALQVKGYKARWGSCKLDGQIQLNWRLIHGPLEIIDYVVVHELCHMLEHNHSRAYWSEVARVMPDFQHRRKWLVDYGSILTL